VPERLVSPGGEPLTDLANAERFVRAYAAELRYVAPWKSWLCWDGKRWARDVTGEAERRAKDTLRGMLVEAAALDDRKEQRARVHHALHSMNGARLDWLLRYARTEPAVAAVPEVFDLDPWVLNTISGTLDLRSGELRPHRRDDLITRLAPVAFDPAARAPKWDQFLVQIAGEHPALIGYLQRLGGYALTGVARVKAFFVLLGGGDNGKTTWVETLRGLMGDYAQEAAIQTFLAHRHETIGNDVATLAGARLVTAGEPEKGRRWNEALLKRLTGGDRVKARRLYREGEEYTPGFKLIFHVNELPSSWDLSPGFWGRVKVVPWRHAIPPAERIENYHEVLLREEAPGILNWLLAGCRTWLADGLGEPPEVRAATQHYRDDSDTLREFWAERIAASDTARLPTTALYTAYKAWCDARNEEPLGSRTLQRLIEERGIPLKRSSSGNTWLGLALKPEPTTAPARREVADALL